ncbi:hypothetical protein [Mycolicibacterium farcinogenes]|uniref:Uncharacterized protein n=1 Tax=Mycolicibacterium farcinogenes TaxID=1802 RepID=A0ACD1FR33_MYCFR|nr:hypothetical protein [Mycolicibacterium farcinogenes]QZH69450.1 hypothetical protein K6L26_30420 [Mycolicibacterium farcinogenes]
MTIVTEYGIVPTLLLVGVALINLAPGAACFLPAPRLASAYGLSDLSQADRDLVSLLRHRAVMLGIVGGVLLAAVVLGAELLLPMAAAAVSMISFVLLVLPISDLHVRLRRVAAVDLVGIFMLGVAVIMMAFAGG